jgi:hypothetical protein
MNDAELDQLYTHLCRTMTELGESSSSLFLARFALLAMTHIDDTVIVRELLAAAAEGLPQNA